MAVEAEDFGATDQLSLMEQFKAMGLTIEEERASIEGFAVLPDRPFTWYQPIEFKNVRGYVAGISWSGRDKDNRTLKKSIKIVIDEAEVV